MCVCVYIRNKTCRATINKSPKIILIRFGCMKPAKYL